MADRFLSIPYLFLRSSTAGGALLFGLIQTFVFARVLSPERFSVSILIGTLGITLWLVDFGLTRILFVRQREAFLAGRKDAVIAGQSMAVLIAYAAPQWTAVEDFDQTTRGSGGFGSSGA